MLGGLEGGVEGKGEGGVNWVVSVGGVSDLKAVVVLSVTVGAVSVVVKVVAVLSVTAGVSDLKAMVVLSVTVGVVSVVVKVVVVLSVTEGGVVKVVVIILLPIGD